MNKMLARRYELQENIGAGGMAQVYKAKDILLNRVVAVKILRDQFASDDGFVRRFRREAQSAAGLSHPNIVSVYDVGKEETDFIVMEYVDGKTLKDLIRLKAPFSEQIAVSIAGQVAEALIHAHANHIVHRDIKSQNILMAKDGRAKVTDFGIARAVSSATLTQTGDIVGSVHYLSPEQAKGEPTGKQSDLYSLGVILYEMLTGQLPFDGDTPIAVALKHIHDEPPSIKKWNQDISVPLESIVKRLLSKDLRERYQSAEELLEDLRKVASGEDVHWEQKQRFTLNDDTKIHTRLGEQVKKGKNQVKKKKKKSGRKVVAVLIVLCVSLLLASGAFALWKSFYVPEVLVPDLLNMTQREAEQELMAARLVLGPILYDYSDEISAERVMGQSFEPDTTVKAHREISITLSKGAAVMKFPDVYTDNPLLENALKRIAQAGFDTEAIEIETEESYLVPKDRVIRQDPAPNAEWPSGGRIKLWVSGGGVGSMAIVPNVVNRSARDASEILEQFSFVVGPSETQESQLYYAGTVMATKPEAGVALREGETVIMVVSLGPGPPI